MKWSSRSRLASAVALLALTAARPSRAYPYLQSDFRHVAEAILQPRECATYCPNSPYCCASGEVCYTVNGAASCSATPTAYSVYTTTWTEIDVYTRTVTVPITATSPAYIAPPAPPAPLPPPAITPVPDCVPTAPNEQQCGSICCADWQYCAIRGSCSPNTGYTPAPIVPTTFTTNGQVTTVFSQAFRITSSTFVATATGAGWAATPAANFSSGGGLSPGAIAGIVIGVLVGISLLILICIWCVLRGVWVRLCGNSRDERRTETVPVADERYSQYASRPPIVFTGPGRHQSWHGREKKEERSGSFGWFSVFLTTLGGLLFLNHRKKKEEQRRLSEEQRRFKEGQRRDRQRRDGPRRTSDGQQRYSDGPLRSSDGQRRSSDGQRRSSDGPQRSSEEQRRYTARSRSRPAPSAGRPSRPPTQQSSGRRDSFNSLSSEELYRTNRTRSRNPRGSRPPSGR